jgi:hypothetical protein
MMTTVSGFSIPVEKWRMASSGERPVDWAKMT